MSLHSINNVEEALLEMRFESEDEKSESTDEWRTWIWNSVFNP